MTSAGDILDPDGFPISTAEGYQWGPSLAWDGTNYLVAWTDERDEGSIYGARVSPDTTVLDPEGIQISFYHDYEAFTSVAWSGTEYLVVWADARHSSSTYAARVTPGGAVLDPDGILVSQWGHYDYTGVAWNGGSFLVAWDDERDLQTRNDVYAARVAEDGTVLDPSGIGVVTEEGMESSPDVVAGEGSALVAWDAVGAGGARIDPAGNVLDPDGIEISTAPGVDGAAVASNGADFFAAWRDTRLGSSLGWKVFGARIQGDGTVLDPEGILISTSANQQGDASVAWDGEHYFVVWADYRPGRPAPDYGIYGARLTADGESLDGTGILLSSAENAQRPHVAWDGTVFLVTWEQWGSTECAICATRVTSSGEVLDPDGLSLSDHLFDSHAVVAASPESFLVGWYRSSTPSSLVVGRVTSSGVVLDPAGIVVGTGGGTSSDPSVAWSGESYLLAWHRQNDIYGGRVAADGTVLDPGGVPISTAPEAQDYPSVAWGGSMFLVAWMDQRNYPYRDAYASRVTSAGVALDPNGIRIGRGDLVSVSWARFSFLVSRSLANGTDVGGNRVAEDGHVVDAVPFDIAASPDDEWINGSVSGPVGRVAVVYGRFATERRTAIRSGSSSASSMTTTLRHHHLHHHLRRRHLRHHHLRHHHLRRRRRHLRRRHLRRRHLRHHHLRRLRRRRHLRRRRRHHRRRHLRRHLRLHHPRQPAAACRA